jgi:hypothetical protein
MFVLLRRLKASAIISSLTCFPRGIRRLRRASMFFVQGRRWELRRPGTRSLLRLPSLLTSLVTSSE